MSRIVLGVAGGIAAYKACELLRRLQGAGHEVTVVPTAAALEFVGVGTGQRCPVSQCIPRSSTTFIWCRMSRSGRKSTSFSSRRRPRTCWLAQQVGGPTIY
jgi:3-polyprenyl-4-hydroxybenzoate decarboxylase